MKLRAAVLRANDIAAQGTQAGNNRPRG
jgi:hypothetical protein